MNITRLPKSGALSYEEMSQVVNTLVDALKYQSPLLNPNVGEAEPPADYRRDGFFAYADGVNWNPKGDGTAGFFQYDETTSTWIGAYTK